MRNYIENKTNESEVKFEDRVKNRFEVEGSSLINRKKLQTSKLFKADNSLSSEFTILQILFTRATMGEASSFKKFMEKNISENERNIIVDLNKCEFIDSSFFGVLVAGVKRLRSMNKKFRLVYNNKKRLPIFSATGLDRIFDVYNSVQEAIDS